MNKTDEILNIKKIYEEAKANIEDDYYNGRLTYREYCRELEDNYQKERAEINQVEQMF